jgi:membrane-associated phospholipid phosphatase
VVGVPTTKLAGAAGTETVGNAFATPLQLPQGVLRATLTDAPEWLLIVAAALTQLADVWFVFLLLTTGYWLAPRLAANPRSVGATLVGIAVGALAVSLGAKALFGFPRPPGAGTASAPAWLPAALGDTVRTAATGEGFGFPSGHALAATAVYGGLATFLDVWTPRIRRLVAGGLIVVVSATRLVLGVHYLGDVLGGVALGLATLWLLARIARSGFEPRPDRVFFTAGLLGIVAVTVALLSGHGESAVEASIAAGGGLGGYLVWRLRGPDESPVGLLGVGLGLLGTGGPFGYAVYVASNGIPAVVGVFPDTVGIQLVAVVVSAALAVGLVIAWPTVLGRLR